MIEKYVELDSTSSSEPRPRYGRDELNLAEFPLASLSDTVPAGQKTLEYSDTIWDHGRRKEVTRKVIVTASDKFGLPTAKDDEVLLALIQLTALNKFTSATVPFTRYQILKELGWRDSSANYKRLELSLNRWLGVTLYYDRAWWSKEDMSWVKISFHILSEVELLDRVTRENRVRNAQGDQSQGRSYFTWNDLVFRNFQAGNLKQLDMEVFRSLKRPTAKRMYRYLSKHFYRKATMSIRLKQFAYEHIGVPRTYHVGELKRFLGKSIKELEDVGFLVPIPGSKRFIKKHGEWYACFEMGRTGKPIPASSGVGRVDSEIVDLLTSRGVSKQPANEIARNHSSAVVRKHVEYFDHLLASKGRGLSDNPAGYLYKSITTSYEIPKTFETVSTREKKSKRAKQNKITSEKTKEAREAHENAERRTRRAWVDQQWAALDSETRDSIESEVARQIRSFLGPSATDGPIVEAMRENIVAKMLRDEAE